jgi:flavin reductase (DIM6/NTAB) family NADH-FMN oxidoreductase RutF
MTIIVQLFHLHDLCPPGSLQMSGTLILGHVRIIHVRNSILNERGTVDADKLRPVARLGGLTYGRLGDSFELPRVSWKKDKDAVQRLREKE